MAEVTFYQTEGKATVVWDRERGCALCEFSGRLLTTDDERTIGILEELGYPKKGEPKTLDDAQQMGVIDLINQGNPAPEASPAALTPQQMAEASAQAAAEASALLDAQKEGSPAGQEGNEGSGDGEGSGEPAGDASPAKPEGDAAPKMKRG